MNCSMKTFLFSVKNLRLHSPMLHRHAAGVDPQHAYSLILYRLHRRAKERTVREVTSSSYSDVYVMV